jgi:AAA family ATP:ADP antiporter
MLTPIVLLGTSFIFFGLFFYHELIPGSLMLLWGLTPTALLAHVGSFQNILSRAAKYTVFDATKEMAFVPLSSQCKLKGKAAIDGVCNRLGKSGGSVIHQWLLILFSSFAASAPYVFLCLIGIIGVWMAAVVSLGQRFSLLTSPNDVKKEAMEPQAG